MNKLVILAIALAALPACKKKSTEKTETKGSAEVAPAGDAGGTGATAAAADAAAAPAWDGKSPYPITEGFATPESVYFDADSDMYLVSNIGKPEPLSADDDGYITRINADGKVTDPKWIDGSKDNVKLDAPKGMAIDNGILYVSDINVVRKFDAKTGEPKGEVKIEGAAFLNDVVAAPDGGVYVTDSALDAKFAGTGADAVYHVGKDDKVKPLIKNKSLAAPNGIVAGDKGSVWVVTFGSGEIYEVDAKGKQAKGQKLPKGQLDGIAKLDGGDLLVSSWEGSAIYRGKPGGEWKPVVENVKSPADIAWDPKRKRILIPSFMGNSVILHPLEN